MSNRAPENEVFHSDASEQRYHMPAMVHKAISQTVVSPRPQCIRDHPGISQTMRPQISVVYGNFEVMTLQRTVGPFGFQTESQMCQINSRCSTSQLTPVDRTRHRIELTGPARISHLAIVIPIHTVCQYGRLCPCRVIA
jgi:hypothetical protein